MQLFAEEFRGTLVGSMKLIRKLCLKLSFIRKSYTWYTTAFFGCIVLGRQMLIKPARVVSGEQFCCRFLQLGP